MVFHLSLSDSKYPQISRTLLGILAVLNNVVVWMVSTRPSTSKSSSSFSNLLVTVPNAPITIGIIVTCIFHSFFSSLARSRYLSFFSHSFSFILWSAGTVKSTFLQVLFFLLIIIRPGLPAEIRWSVCMSIIIISITVDNIQSKNKNTYWIHFFSLIWHMHNIYVYYYLKQLNFLLFLKSELKYYR